MGVLRKLAVLSICLLAIGPAFGQQVQLPPQQATVTLSPQQVDVVIPPPQVNVNQAAPRVSIQQEPVVSNQAPSQVVPPLPALPLQQRLSHPAPIVYPAPIQQQFYMPPAVQFYSAPAAQIQRVQYVTQPAPVVLRSSNYCPAPAAIVTSPQTIVNVNNQKKGLLGRLFNRNKAPQTQVIVQ